MSAELLRQAADRLDALADAATPGPWTYLGSGWGNGSHATFVKGDEFDLALKVEASHDEAARPEADLIAALADPRIAKALAAWLRQIAETVAVDEHDGSAGAPGCECPWCDQLPHALATARAVLASP